MSPASSTRLTRKLWLLFGLFIIYGTTIPFHFTRDRTVIADKWQRALVVPIGRRMLSGSDVVQNVMLFLPFGALAAMSLRPGARSAARLTLAGVTSAVVSVAVEGAQLFTVDRTASLADVIANTAGGVFGAAGLLVAREVGFLSLRSLLAAGFIDGVAFYNFLVAAAVVFAAAWEPFDVTLEGSGLIRKARRLYRDPWQYSGLNDEATTLMHCALLAMAICAWLAALRIKRPARYAVLAGVPLVIGLEASQFFITSRMPGAEDALVAAGGVVVGSILWSIWTRTHASSRVWMTLSVAATAGAAAMSMWNPFQLAAQFQPFQWFPFMNYYAFTTFETLSHVLELWLLYIPLGFTAGLVWREPDKARLAALTLSFLIAAPMEYGQGWIVGRFPDITDIAMSVVGGYIGVWLQTQAQTLFKGLLASLKRA